IKGWSLRAVTEFETNELITEYVGEITLEKSTGRAQQCDYDLSYKAEREDGSERPLNICAYKKGNESRYISHACEPNAYFQTTIVSRAGLCVNSGAILAKKTILRGEEITLDYFSGKGIFDEDMGDVTHMFPPSGCACGSPNCRFTKELLEEYKKKYHTI
ncbi:hypothetical protein PENTCL1PPCAC_13968, partial [Pristionchus entomophagus]